MISPDLGPQLSDPQAAHGMGEGRTEAEDLGHFEVWQINDTTFYVETIASKS